MKKLIIAAALGFAGLVSAKSSDSDSKSEIIKQYESNKLLQQEWPYAQYWYWFTICGSNVAYIFEEPSFYEALEQAQNDQTACEKRNSEKIEVFF